MMLIAFTTIGVSFLTPKGKEILDMNKADFSYDMEFIGYNRSWLSP
jgi:hypothetical protein